MATPLPRALSVTSGRVRDNSPQTGRTEAGTAITVSGAMGNRAIQTDRYPRILINSTKIPMMADRTTTPAMQIGWGTLYPGPETRRDSLYGILSSTESLSLAFLISRA
jgi:hypothetical protein